MATRLLSYRCLNIYAAFFTIAIVLYAMYTQIYGGLKPCPLCIMQRLVFMVLALFFIGGSLFVLGKLGRKIYHSIALIIAVFGIGVAIRHVYLQHLPAGSAPACGPGFNFIVQNLPFTAAVRSIFLGSGECAVVNWHLLGLTMPEWSLLCFVLLAVVNVVQIRR